MSQKSELSPDLGHEEIQEILKLGTDLREYSQEIEKELVKVRNLEKSKFESFSKSKHFASGFK